ncbi:phosphate ABC transporter permease subunit PstC [Candidatus Nucleicultrix amoebiphila]|jgi:phosphate transport system permease protein|uniref:phosphate ABC transporter permease subunit PstC n=1 Tax=Candidatus Nucleicultrix amoebiphila TaxID=1509244 RepID=UPI000A27072F|nr:phosphate ABC transporter permease subunit PstC [Candidatus Nucleicultrix amoebiphila]
MIKPSRKRTFEFFIKILLWLSAFIAILITTSLVLSLIFEAIRFFKIVNLFEFLTGTHWEPEITFDTNNPEISSDYGVLPLFSGTLLITLIALITAVPLGLLIAIYTSEYAHPKTRLLLKPLVEILAGIPTIVYGFFAIILVAPLLRGLSKLSAHGFNISSESALGAGIVMGFMIIPFISSLTDDALRAIPQTYRDNSLALGATQSETIRKIVVPSALPSIIASILLALSRAIGETMLVVMAAGLTANFTLNPLDSVTTVTVQIVNVLTGDQEFNSPKTLSAFALGLTLFIVTFLINFIAQSAVKRHRKKYAL